MMDVTFFFAFLAILISAIYLADFYLNSHFSHSPREPPLLSPPLRIPLLGHAFGLIRYSIGYYTRLSKVSTHKIYTVRILNAKLYIVNSSSVLPALQRASRTVSFRPFERLTVKTFSAGTAREMAILDEGAEFKGSGDGKLIRDVENAMARVLGPGKDLDDMNKVTGDGFLMAVEELAGRCGQKSGGSVELDIYEWLRDAVTIHSGRGTFGPNSPYDSTEARDAFWQFEKDGVAVLFGFEALVPTTRRAIKTLVRHFTTYHLSGESSRASGLVRERNRIFKSYDLNAEVQARWDWPLSLAVFSNTVPSSFWMLWDIFSRPQLLAEIRTSLADAVTTTSTEAAGEQRKHHTLDLARLKAHCPILLATFQEMQRTRTVFASVRKVLADTVLEGYLLKAGNYLQFPSEPVHTSAKLWGDDTTEFRPERFLNSAAVGDSAADGDGKPIGMKGRAETPAFLAFGFAPQICPGRQFAASEIIMLVALMVLRLDLEPADGKGWSQDSMVMNPMPMATVPALKPGTGKLMRFKAREEWSGDWSLNVGVSGVKFALASG